MHFIINGRIYIETVLDIRLFSGSWNESIIVGNCLNTAAGSTSKQRGSSAVSLVIR